LYHEILGKIELDSTVYAVLINNKGVSMKVKSIGSNQTEIETKAATILVSYSTPVAACMTDGTGFIRTSTKYGVTTSHHINKWLGGAKAQVVDQSVLDNLI
jgi:hypothetical protein